jgi:hypothetical protein
MRNLRALTAVMALLLAGCGGIFGRASDDVRVTGAVFSDHRVDLPCEEQASDPMRPQELSGIRLLFADGMGNRLGDAVTGELRWRRLDYGCRFFAEYSVTLFRSAEYHVDFDPPQPRDIQGAMFLGAEDLEPQRIRHAELEEQAFEWSFEAEPSYAVP